MAIYYVKKNDIYKVTATVSCDVLDGDNKLIAVCQSGETISFKAPTSKISLSDDNAVLSRGVESSGDIGDVDDHMCDPSIHCTPEEKDNWNAAVDGVTTTLTELEDKVNEHISDDDAHVADSDRSNWDNKLDYSALYARKLIGLKGVVNGNVNAYGFTYIVPRSGYVTALTCHCHTTQGTSTQAESGKVLIKLWRDYSLLTVSANKLECTSGGVLHYWFKDKVFVNEGDLLYVTFHVEGNENSTTLGDGIVECYMESVTLTPDNQGGILDSNGDISDTTRVVNHTWYIDAEKYAPWEHIVEDGSHGIVGEIKYRACNGVPNGWLLCDGSAVSRSDYPRLFAAIGTTWGEGDGSSTFNLPNLIDRVAWGSSTSGEYLDAGLPNITGSFSVTDGYTTPSNLVIGNATGAFSKETGATNNFGTFDYSSNESGKLTKATFDASRSSDIYGKSVTVQPPAAKLIPIIKY